MWGKKTVVFKAVVKCCVVGLKVLSPEMHMDRSLHLQVSVQRTPTHT